MKITKIRQNISKEGKLLGVFFELDGKNAFEHFDWINDITTELERDLGITLMVDGEDFHTYAFDTSSDYAEGLNDQVIKPASEFSQHDIEVLLQRSLFDSNYEFSWYYDFYKDQVKYRASSIGLVRFHKNLKNIGE